MSSKSNDNTPSTRMSVSDGSNDNTPSTSMYVSDGSNDNTPSTSTTSSTSVGQTENGNSNISQTTHNLAGTVTETCQPPLKEKRKTEKQLAPMPSTSRCNETVEVTSFVTGQIIDNRGAVVGTAEEPLYVQTGENSTMNISPDPMAKLIGESNERLEFYRKNDRKLFVESPAFNQCQADCKKNRHTVIFGAPGDGKTTIGLEVLCRVQESTNKKTIPIIINNKDDWKRVNLPFGTDKEYVILFDDMLGPTRLNDNLKDFWISELPKILSFLKNGKIQVIITCKESIFCTAKNDLESVELFNAKSRIHLSGSNCEYPLREETRYDIITKHIELKENMEICADISKEVLSPKSDQHCCISIHTLRKISGKSYVGFMQMCKLFVSSPEFLSKGEKFFDHPGVYLVQEINRLREADDNREKYKYCTLVCVLVKQGLNVNQIDGDEVVGKIANICRITSTSALESEIKLSVKQLMSTYLFKINDKYQFQHGSWVMSIFKSFFELKASLLVEYCEFGLLVDLITTENNCVKSAGLCELSKSDYPSLFQRLLLEMAAGNLRSVFIHQCFTDANFTMGFRNWLNSDKKRKQDLLMSGEPDIYLLREGDTKRSVLYWAARKCDVDFIDWVGIGLSRSGKWYMKEEMSAALLSACRGGNLPVCNWLLSQTGIEVRDECIEDAAISGHVDVVNTLLNSDKTFSCLALSQGLRWACRSGDIDVCNAILTQPGVDRGMYWGDCVNWAAQSGNIDVVMALMNYRQFTSNQLCQGLQIACLRGHINVFSLLLTQPGVDGGLWWGWCLSAVAQREKLDGDSRFTSLLKTKGYVIPDVKKSDESEVTDDDIN